MTTVDRQVDPDQPDPGGGIGLDHVDGDSAEQTPARARRRGRWRARLGSVELLAAVILLAIVLRGLAVDLFGTAGVLAFLTVFASVVVAGLPFVVFGAAVSAAVTAFVPTHVFDRLRTLPGPASVPAGVAAGFALPAGEDGAASAAALVRRGIPVATVLAYLLASPALSPVVLVATVVAFPGEPAMVLARLAAGLLVAVGMGMIWLRLGRPDWLAPALGRPASAAPAVPRVASAAPSSATDAVPDDGGRPARGWPVFLAQCRVDIIRAGGFLVAGALVVAALQAWLPSRWLDAIAGSGLFAVVFMALLAVLLSIQGGADAFLGAALSQFSPTARLAFLIVGPVANLRLFTRLVGTFGPRFALRATPLALALGLLLAMAVGAVMF